MSEDIKSAYLGHILAELQGAEELLTKTEYLDLLDKVHDVIVDREILTEDVDEQQQ